MRASPPLTWFLDADFRGPCAVHDVCYHNKSLLRPTCDDILGVNLFAECRFAYGDWWESAPLAACMATAEVYWAAVSANTLWGG